MGFVRKRAFSALSVASLGMLAASNAHAEYIGYVYQDGTNVVASGSGSLNTSSLTFTVQTAGATTSVYTSIGFQTFGDVYHGINVYGGFTGPTSFGTGGPKQADSYTGFGTDILAANNEIVVALGYVSGEQIAGTAAFDNTTLSALGFNNGTSTWTWGRGDGADSMVIEVGTAPPASVPEPASLALLGAGFAGLGLLRRRRKTA
ncbi:MAG TPA: VPLPA-CTERM sorting domain-containing protein [Aliidongia sp.]|uniref:VPLPA-CTERM sorting domain-containing protein n=1 Tax=Aliidongia sp. TaxID=1914230 RepID=UPI002DDCCB10|nr:VPLPA-CTERM sorting domain-containing protein [Aliidongia sp.]HEV2673239.1 VPLPA-CTERM sorting domain-containing protein [Aliidongia sp.]